MATTDPFQTTPQPAPTPAVQSSATQTPDTTGTAGALAAAAGNTPSDFTPGKLQSLTGATQDATTYKPDDSALVSKNLSTLLSGDSSYIQNARNQALAMAQSRGLLNSSIAAGAGEQAAIQSALPIAQGDANVNASAQAANANAKNSFALDANQFARQGALAAVNAGFQASTQANDQTFKGAQAGLDRSQKQTQFDADLALRTKQANADITQKTAAQAQDLTQQYLNARLSLETTPNLDPAAKANAINAMASWFYGSALPDIRAIYGNPDQWPGAVTAPPTGPASAPAPGAAPGAAPPPPGPGSAYVSVPADPATTVITPGGSGGGGGSGSNGGAGPFFDQFGREVDQYGNLIGAQGGGSGGP